MKGHVSRDSLEQVPPWGQTPDRWLPSRGSGEWPLEAMRMFWNETEGALVPHCRGTKCRQTVHSDTVVFCEFTSVIKKNGG